MRVYIYLLEKKSINQLGRKSEQLLEKCGRKQLRSIDVEKTFFLMKSEINLAAS